MKIGQHSHRPETRPIVALRPFDSTTIPSDCRYRGSILAGSRWSDANGENLLIVSGRETVRDDATTQELFGYLYLLDGDSTRLIWQIRDAADNYCDRGKGLVSGIATEDLDGDGVAENAFVYNLVGACDVSPIPYKLIMHSGATKLAVRGYGIDVAGEGGDKAFDPAFDAAPKGFRAFASRFWDRYVPDGRQQ
jgi:hypothetical protein